METFTVEVLSVRGTQVEVSITGDQGTRYKTALHAAGESELKASVNALTARLSATAKPVKPGPLDMTTPAPVVVPPTQAELDQKQFFADYDKERTDQILATLTPALAARYKPEYGPLR